MKVRLSEWRHLSGSVSLLRRTPLGTRAKPPRRLIDRPDCLLWTAPDSGMGMAREKSGMKPGRNDPCPCGSGKKYKKCCLGKAAQSPATKAVAERRFRFPVHSFYTQAALEEALKPGGTIEIHPYVLLKLREDPRMEKRPVPRIEPDCWNPGNLPSLRACPPMKSRVA